MFHTLRSFRLQIPLVSPILAGVFLANRKNGAGWEDHADALPKVPPCQARQLLVCSIPVPAARRTICLCINT